MNLEQAKVDLRSLRDKEAAQLNQMAAEVEQKTAQMHNLLSTIRGRLQRAAASGISPYKMPSTLLYADALQNHVAGQHSKAKEIRAETMSLFTGISEVTG